MERCRSGLTGRPGKSVYSQEYHGFESHSLRQIEIVPEIPSTSDHKRRRKGASVRLEPFLVPNCPSLVINQMTPKGICTLGQMFEKA